MRGEGFGAGEFLYGENGEAFGWKPAAPGFVRADAVALASPCLRCESDAALARVVRPRAFAVPSIVGRRLRGTEEAKRREEGPQRNF